uniref:Cytochrome c oxidase subunit 2 n=1 Tax=Lissoclinum patella TaxID=13110 RepID=A0A059VEK9_9ASCI|nr:cytochrome c oxidase subunit II [Lissoclinum patella]
MMPYDGLNFTSLSLGFFHNFTLFFGLLIIFFLVLDFFLCTNTSVSNLSYMLYKMHKLEFFWTTYPMVLLVGLSVPSFYLLYTFEKNTKYMITMKTIGHQWYWSYECSDFGELDFDSYMVNGLDRCLSVDNSLVLPYGSKIRMLVNSFDVLHSWTLPSLYLKVDAVPGRLNSILINNLTPGGYYGQCSEICGANHSFMPIHIEFIKWVDFINWYKKMLE